MGDSVFYCNVTDMTDFSAIIVIMNDVIWLSSELTDAYSFVQLMFTFTEHHLLVLYS